jgi:hypothetical protein
MKNINKYLIFTMITLSLYAEAEAIVGRPLTPVSVAGVARRTVRRCATGVYYCQAKPAVTIKLPTTQKG